MITPKLIAFYFPQFHSTVENDEWWGEGFHDWKLVKEATPLFRGHNQPRLPIDQDYYNPCNKETLLKQVALAKEYGVGGFMLYHYWFDGKLLLEKPLEMIRDNKEIDFPFCICWANESWTRSWAGRPDVYLQQQQHSPDPNIWTDHFNYLLPFLKDERAIKKDGKPIIIIYQPHLIVDTKQMFELWNRLARDNGLEGIYYIANKNHNYATNTSFLENYNGLLKFQPREANTSPDNNHKSILDRMQFLRILPDGIIRYLRKIKQEICQYSVISSEYIWQIIQKNAYKNDYPKYDLDIYESGFFEWDNTPRYKKKAKIFLPMTRYQKLNNLRLLQKKAIEHNSEFIFWNAWNEWSESSYLEPDTNLGYENLEIVKEIFVK